MAWNWWDTRGGLVQACSCRLPLCRRRRGSTGSVGSTGQPYFADPLSPLLADGHVRLLQLARSQTNWYALKPASQ